MRARACLVLLLVTALPAVALAESGGGGAEVKEAKDAPKTVLTYYGLRKLELDEAVSDEEKLREWEAFLVRGKEQLKYAEQAVDRWKNAARLRVIDNIQKEDQSPDLAPVAKLEAWERLLRLYPDAPEAKTAKKRVAYWRAEETKRRVEAAEFVEKNNASKVERIRAWREVFEWVKKGPEASAADKRIRALADQLYAEASSLHKIGRVAPETKLAGWRDVLAGSPTAAQKKEAEEQVRALEAVVPPPAPKVEARPDAGVAPVAKGDAGPAK